MNDLAPSAWRVATQWPVVRRATAMSAIVGTVLAGINHGDSIVSGAIAPSDAIRVALTYLVTYTVSTVSSLLAIRDATLQGRGRLTYVDDRTVKIPGRN